MSRREATRTLISSEHAIISTDSTCKHVYGQEQMKQQDDDDDDDVFYRNSSRQDGDDERSLPSHSAYDGHNLETLGRPSVSFSVELRHPRAACVVWRTPEAYDPDPPSCPSICQSWILYVLFTGLLSVADLRTYTNATEIHCVAASSKLSRIDR